MSAPVRAVWGLNINRVTSIYYARTTQPVFAGSSKPVLRKVVAIFNSCMKVDRFLASTAFDYVFESTEGQRTEAEYSPDNFIGVTEGRRE